MNILVKYFFSLLIFVICGITFAQEGRDPSGEEAFYKVVKGSRTSSMIKSGEVNSEVGDKKMLEGVTSYEVDLDYKFKIDLLGMQKGTETIDVPEEYFSEAFLEKLREEKSYSSSSFKVKHLGFVNTETIGGEVYKKCDKLLFYDVDSKALPNLRKSLKALAIEKAKLKGMAISSSGGIDDLEITALIKYGVPVLGAVKIDVSGKYKGMKIKAGADYDP